MTTTVKKGSGRPAASERRNRHAQTTPLPPKPGVVQDAKDAIVEANAVANRYGMLPVDSLKVRARELGIKPVPRTKGELLTAILKAETAEQKIDAQMRQESKTTDKIDAAFAPTTPAAKATQAKAIERLDGKSGRKAEAFANEAMRLGWKAEAKLHDGDRVTLTAKRGEESIDIEWLGGVFQDNCTYHHNGRTAIKLRNASAAKARMTVPAASANEEAAKVTAHKSVRPAAAKATSGHPRAVKLPFNNASLDQEVLDAVYGKRLTWTNSISEQSEEDRVPALSEVVTLRTGERGTRKQYHPPRISEGPRGRIIHFVGAMGFRSVALSSITRVS